MAMQAWNVPGTVRVLKKGLVSAWNHTLKVDDHVKKWWMLKELMKLMKQETDESELITRAVPRTKAIKSYFDAACIIDVHNHLCQGSPLHLVDSVGTKRDWWFQYFCTVLGFIKVYA